MAIRGPAQCFGHLIDGLELGQDAVPDVRAARPRRALEPCLQEDGDDQVFTQGASPDSDNPNPLDLVFGHPRAPLLYRPFESFAPIN